MKKHRIKNILKILGISVASFIVGLLIRLSIQPIMGTKVIWLTFYPAIMISALLGGFVSGLLSITFTLGFAVYGWMIIGSERFIASLPDVIGAVVFVLNTTMMSLVAWGMRRANERSRAARLRAEAADRAKSVFLAQMSHELRTPFNAILGFTNQLLRAQDTTQRQREVLSIISRSANHLLELINNVLDMSRIDATTRDQAELKPFSVRELLRDVVELLAKRGEQKGIELMLDIAANVPHLVVGDPRKLRQIVINLVGNAIKFSPRGTVALKLTRLDEPAGAMGWLRLSVLDQGPGIAPEFHEAIFEPFRKIDPDGSIEGSGLGLSIARQLAAAIGGTIRVASEPGQGACFTVDWPAPAASAATHTETEASDHEKTLRLAPGQPRITCLVVDDSLDNRLLMKSYHDELGLDCLLADNGRLGVELCSRRLPDFIWMDIRMSDKDGIETMRAIKALPGAEKLPVVAVTASVFAADRARLEASGFSAVLFKPVSLEQLGECLERFLDLRFQSDEELVGARSAATAYTAAGQAEAVPITVAELSEPERRSLLSALDTLDPRVINATIDALAGVHPELVSNLRKAARSYRYTAIRSRLVSGRP
ncbi:MAG: hypothetical protein A2Y38_13125 [Spirochaetes bacterium GWB1_59_5]|nr:MAG: hypothetical protein A2Y38_13125 [Spirochaetes bacterium GWB1_59_5]